MFGVDTAHMEELADPPGVGAVKSVQVQVLLWALEKSLYMKILFPWILLLLGYSVLYAENPHSLAIIPFVLAFYLFVEQIRLN